MPAVVHIPGTLQQYCGACSEFDIKASNVRKALGELESRFPSLYESICDETGTIRRHINLFVNSDLVLWREPTGLDVPLRSGDVLTIWTAVSGG